MLRKLLWQPWALPPRRIGAAQTATFGIRVPIGGEATDLALDQPRGVLYIANFTASRIDRMNLATFQLQAPIPVDPNPVSMSLSPDLHWLLVAHYDNPATGTATNNHLTLIDLVNGTRSRRSRCRSRRWRSSFGADNQAFVVTTTEFLQYDPGSNSTTSLGTIASLGPPRSLPVPDATFPPDITAASVSRSGDGMTIYGVGGTSQTITFHLRRAIAYRDTRGHRAGQRNRGAARREPQSGWIDGDGRLDHAEATAPSPISFPKASNQFSVGTSAL